MKTLTTNILKGIILIALFQIQMLAAFPGQNVYDSGHGENGNSLYPTTDGGFIITGGAKDASLVSDDLYLIRLDAGGDTLWTKKYGGPLGDYGTEVRQTTDGGFIAIGTTASYGAGSTDFYFIRTDASGDTLWTRTVGGTNLEFGQSVYECHDGGFIATGGTASYGFGDYDLYLVRLNASGTVRWARTVGGQLQDFGQHVKQTPDLGFIAAGNTYSYGVDSSDYYLVKTDSAGVIEFTRTYGGQRFEIAEDVEMTSDGGYIVSGYTESFGAGMADYYVVKTDASGALMWSKTYGGADNDYGFKIEATPDSKYVMAGQTESFGAGGFDAFTVKLDLAGAMDWASVYGGVEDDNGRDIINTLAGHYAFVGRTNSFGDLDGDVYLVVTDVLGASGCMESYVAATVFTPPTMVFSGGFQTMAFMDAAGAICSNMPLNIMEVCATSCEPVAGTSTTRVTTSSARLIWTPVPGADHYVIRGKIAGGSAWTYLTISSPLPAMKDVFGLSNNTTYVWQIQTYCSASTADSSDWSPETFFTTGCFAPATTSTAPISATGASLNWSSVPGAAGYEIRGRRVGAGTWKTILVAAGTISKTVFGLTPSTSYEWTIRTICDTSGTPVSDWTPLETFTTSAGARLAGVSNSFSTEENPGFNIFPNPVQNRFRVSGFEASETGEIVIQIFDLSGREVLTVFTDASGVSPIEVDASTLTTGIYQVLINAAGKSDMHKMVVTK